MQKPKQEKIDRIEDKGVELINKIYIKYCIL